MDYLYIMIGLAGLFVGGEALVRGSVQIAQGFSISPFVIGLTVVGFGTSTPELLVSIQAALAGIPDIAVGNIVGSNIANILLIVGVTTIVWPIRVKGISIRRDIVTMLCAGILLIPLFALGEIGRVPGAMLVGALVLYLGWTFMKTPAETEEKEAAGAATPLLLSLLWVAGGLVVLLFGARFLIEGAVSVARTFGLSEAFIGLTIVAVGTSLPELATSLVAAFRRQSDIAIGNIVGSNIFNVLGILGVTAVVLPIPVASRFATFDLPVMIGASLLLAGMLLFRPVISRTVGVGMLLAYGAYIFAAQ